MGWLDGVKPLTTHKIVRWDRSKTSIEAADLAVSASSETSFGSAIMRIYLNGREVLMKFWDFNGPHVETVSVLDALVNGTNTFVVTYEKNPVITVEAHLTITATLNYAFSGDPPGVGDDWLANLLDWLDRNKYTVLGVSMASVGIVYYGSQKGWFR